MGLFSNWIDKMSGASMKTDVNQFMTDYDTAYDPVNKNYEKMQGIAEGMMDPYSQNNLRQRSLITDMGADAAAESSRLGGRNAAMQGGAPAAALAMQTQDQANKVQAGGIKSFNEFLGGQYNQGLSAFSGVTSNMATMAGNRFNTQQNLTQTNKQIDANASKWGTNMIGGLLQGGAGALTGNPMMALGGLGNAFGGGQRGGYVQKYALGGGVKPSGGAQPDSIGAKFGRQSMDEIDDSWGRMPMNNEMFRPDNIMPESSPDNPRFYDKDPGPSGFQDMPSGFQDSPDFMQRKNDELKRQPPTDPRQGKFYEAMMEQNPEFQQRKENSLLNMQKAQQGMGGMMGGIMGQSGGYVMKGGDIGGYEEKLENLDEDWEAKLNSNLYTSEGDYTREGLLDQYGFSNEAAVDTSYGGQSPNQAVGMNIREGDRNMRLDFDAHNRWQGDKDTADLRLRNRWAHQDPKAYSEFMQKSMGSQGDPDFDFMNEGNDFMDDENPKSVWDFQEGGEVKGGGILTQVMGPKGPMNLQTRIGGIKLG